MSEDIGDTNGYLSVRRVEPRAPSLKSFKLLSPSSAASSPGGGAAATGSGVRPRPKIAHTQRLGQGYNQRVDELAQERDELEAMVEERDAQLTALKNSISALNTEYMGDLQSVREECEELVEMSRDKTDKFNKLEIEHQKSLKTIKGLQAYITTLPPVDEVRDLRAKLEARTNQLAENETRSIELEQQHRLVKEELMNCRKEKLKLELTNKELKEINKEMSLKVKEDEKRRMKARNIDNSESQVELLVFDKEEMKIENDKLKKLLDWKTKKFDDEKSKLEDQVRNFSNLLEETSKKLQENSTHLREANAGKVLSLSPLITTNKLII